MVRVARQGQRSGKAARTTAALLYETMAAAYGENQTLFKSWCEQGILRPAEHARGTGTRRSFDRPTAIKAGILVELRRLLGVRFRPGEIGKLVAQLEPNLIDRGRDDTPMLLVIYRKKGAFAEHYTALDPTKLAHLAKRHSSLLIVNLTAINERLCNALEN